LNKDIEEWNKCLPEQKVIELLSQLNIDELPRRNRAMVKAVLWGKGQLEERRAELDRIIIKAEKAAHRIENEKMRRVAKLYCLDGLDSGEVAKQCSFSKATACKYIKLLNKRPEGV
jgi:hypothetical protein